MNWINLVLSALVSSIAVIFSAGKLSNEKLSIKVILKFVIIFLPISTINYIFLDGISRLITTIIITTMSLYFSIFNGDISKSFYYTLVYEILVSIVEIILSVIFVLIFKFNVNNYESFSFSLLLFSLLNCLIVYLLSSIKILNKNVRNFNKIISKKAKDWIYIIIMSILMFLLLAFNRYNLVSNLSFYINVLMVIFVFVTLIYVIYNNFQKDKIQIKYNEMMEYVSKYEKIINEQGKKNHEYNNQLMVIKGYANSPKKLREYLELVVDEHKCGQNYTVKQLGLLPDGGIKGLIYHKLSKMEENNVKPYLYIDSETKNIIESKFDIMTYRDITKLLGVFLDNAIEAAKDAEIKEVELDIKNKDGYLLIIISNTYKSDTDVSQIGKKGYSSKGAGHGFGLSIVKDISKNNDNIDTFSSVDDNKFTQTTMLYYKK